MVAVRGPGSAAAPHPARQTPPAHEPRYPVSSTGVARPPQRPVQARAAVGASAAREEHADLLAQGGIGPVPLAGPTLTPGVEARARHVEGLAQVADRIGLLHGFDQGETLPFGPAKIPTAFFKMSRWLVTLWSWARSRRTSAANSCALGAPAGSLPPRRGRRGLRPGELPPPRP